jgi:hypothetical protein
MRRQQLLHVSCAIVFASLSISASHMAANTQPEPAGREHVLKNLSSGPPADPLPPLRPNHPSATEMAAQPRQHPYLFFDAQSRHALRDRANSEPFRSLAQRLKTHAEECLTRPLPAPATIRDGMPQFLADGSFNPDFLRATDHNQFAEDAYLMAEVIPTLGFAYQLTGDQRYAETGRKWLLNLASWQKFAPKGKEADFDAGHYAYALALGYDWLWEVLDESGRHEVQEALMRIAGPMVVQAQGILARTAPQMARGYMEGNHPRRTHGLFALTPLALLYEVPAAREWLDIEIQLQRDRLYPSAFAPDGEHGDAWDHFRTSFDDPTPFAVALQRMGGEDLFNDPTLVSRFRGLPHFFLYGLEQRFGNSWYCPSWLALASRLKDPLAQWIGTRDTAFQNVDEVMAYLFYDPEIPAAPPKDPTGSVYFPYSGMVKICSGWNPDSILIPFRCGPEIAKDQGDQNSFRLRAGGEWLLPRLIEARRKPSEPAEVAWDFLGWYHGSPAQNVVLPDPDQVGDEETYEKTGRIPIKAGVQFGENPPMKGREYAKQWLSGPEITKNGSLRVVVFDDALDYVCGEAHRAFSSSRPALWLRHVLFVKGREGLPPYVLICDELEAGEQPQTFAWQLHPRNPFDLRGRDVAVTGDKSGLDVHLLAPADGVVVKKQSPSAEAALRLRFIQWRTPAPQSRAYFLTALQPHAKNASATPLSFRALEATGGWAVEVRSGQNTDVALFRSERAKSISVGNWSTQGTAALFRQQPGTGNDGYVMGR